MSGEVSRFVKEQVNHALQICSPDPDNPIDVKDWRYDCLFRSRVATLADSLVEEYDVDENTSMLDYYKSYYDVAKDIIDHYYAVPVLYSTFDTEDDVEHDVQVYWDIELMCDYVECDGEVVDSRIILEDDFEMWDFQDIYDDACRRCRRYLEEKRHDA